MISLATTVIILKMIFGFQVQPPCEAVTITFGGKKWSFPSSVEEAVRKHNLSYKAPGYYYKVDTTQMKLILGYHFNPGDFSNEYQAKEVLFSRELHSYIFQFPDRPNLYDSLQSDLENTYEKKFILTKGIKDSEYAAEKEFEFKFLTVNSCLTIGIKRSRPEKKEKTITVRFMYNLPLGKMGIQMENY